MMRVVRETLAGARSFWNFSGWRAYRLVLLFSNVLHRVVRWLRVPMRRAWRALRQPPAVNCAARRAALAVRAGNV